MNSSKFYALSYTHDEIENLLEEVSTGTNLTDEEYKKLIFSIGLDNISTFDGDYNKLRNKPDIETMIRGLDFADIAYVAGALAELEDDLMRADNTNYNKLIELVQETKTYIEKLYISKTQLTDVLTAMSKGHDFIPKYEKPTLELQVDKKTISHKKETTITLSPNYSKNDAGYLIEYLIYKNEELIMSSAELLDYVDNITLNHNESVTYKAIVRYYEGEIKNTLLNEPYKIGKIENGHIESTVVIQACGESYYGSIDEDDMLTAEDVNKFTVITNYSKGAKVTYKLNMQKSVYMYPSSFGLITSIKDINNFDYINSYDYFTMNYNDIEYSVYVLKDAVIIDGFVQSYS